MPSSLGEDINNNMAKKQINKKNEDNSIDMAKAKKEMLTLFLFLLPILLIAFTEELITKVLLFFFEAVLLRNFIADKVQPTSP